MGLLFLPCEQHFSRLFDFFSESAILGFILFSSGIPKSEVNNFILSVLKYIAVGLFQRPPTNRAEKLL
jgi:hypothetical protein